MHPHGLAGGSNEDSHPSSPMKMQDHEKRYLKEESNQRLELFSESNNIVESKNENFDAQLKDLNFSYPQYKNILSHKFDNEIEESPPNAQKYFRQHAQVENVASYLQRPYLDDAKSQEHWQQE